MNFVYNLINAEHIPADVLAEVEHALEIRAYVCQQDFEKALDVCHEINVIDDEHSSGEATVTAVEIDGDDATVTLDLGTIKYV